MYRQKGSPVYLFSIVLVAVIGGLLFGYDTAVISGAEKGLQAFFKGASDFNYTDGLHGFTSSSALIGCIIGAFISGILASNLGRKKTLFVAGVLFLLSALGSYFPEFLFFQKGVATKGLLVAFNCYRILGGVGVGLASALCPMYIAEVAPASKKGKLVSWNQFAIIFGQLVVYFVNYLIIRSHANDPAVVEWTNAVGWRVMFLSEAVPAGLFALLILLVPETPRFLVLNHRDDEALTVLSNINGEAKAREIISEIKDTAVEKKENILAYGLMVVFIGCMLSVFQQVIGINAVLYFAPRIFESMGVSNNMLFTVIMGVINNHRFSRNGSGRFWSGLEQRREPSRFHSCAKHNDLQRVLHVQLGPDLLGVYRRTLPEHDTLRGDSHRCGLPVDIQLYSVQHFRADVQLEPFLRLRPLRCDLSYCRSLRLEAGPGDQGKDFGGHDRLLEKVFGLI